MDLFDVAAIAIDTDIIQAIKAAISKDDRAIVQEAHEILYKFTLRCEELQQRRKLQQQRSLLWELYKSSNWGFVYVMHLWGKVYKIGRSIRPQARLVDVRCGVREYLTKMGAKEQKTIIELVHEIKTPDMCWAEKELHRRYRNKQTKIQHLGWGRLTYTELFELDDRDLVQIQMIDMMMPPQFANIKDMIVAEGNVPLNGIEWGNYG